MAKKRENKNRSYREQMKKQKELELLKEKAKEKKIKIIAACVIVAIIVLTALLVCLNAFDVLNWVAMVAVAGAMFAYAIFCFVVYVKRGSINGAKMVVEMSICGATLALSGYIFR